MAYHYVAIGLEANGHGIAQYPGRTGHQNAAGYVFHGVNRVGFSAIRSAAA